MSFFVRNLKSSRGSVLKPLAKPVPDSTKVGKLTGFLEANFFIEGDFTLGAEETYLLQTLNSGGMIDYSS